MFTGIIEDTGKVLRVEKEGTNKVFIIESTKLAAALKVDQSVSHNGVCLTVEKITVNSYRVTAIEETLERSNLHALKKGDIVNLERSVRSGSMLDGHIVQGHVDRTVKCMMKKDLNGSWTYRFELPARDAHLLVEKGSICLNGVSLTLSAIEKEWFEVSIIPYTHRHTNFYTLSEGGLVNVEYDIIGKYIARYLSIHHK